jgi:hypothetical protein
VVCVQLRAFAPEVLVFMQNGAAPARALAEVSELAALPGWWGLPAVKTGRVYIVDHALFLRPGPRIVRPLSVSPPLPAVRVALSLIVRIRLVWWAPPCLLDHIPKQQHGCWLCSREEHAKEMMLT